MAVVKAIFVLNKMLIKSLNECFAVFTIILSDWPKAHGRVISTFAHPRRIVVCWAPFENQSTSISVLHVSESIGQSTNGVLLNEIKYISEPKTKIKSYVASKKHRSSPIPTELPSESITAEHE